MSHSFSVGVNKPLSIRQVTQEAGIDDLSFLDGYSESKGGLWPDGLTYIYRDNISVRTVETEHFGSSINIRIFSASSPEDYDMALRIVAAIAKIQDEKIEPEDNDSMTLEEYSKAYDTEWATEHAKTMIAMTINQVQSRPDSIARISGVHRTMTFGKRVLDQILKASPNADIAFYHRLRTLNFIDNQDVYQPMTMICSNKKRDKNVRVSTYTEDVPSVICDQNTLINLVSDTDLGNTGGNVLTVPAHELPGLIEDAIWLDEKFLLLPGFTGDKWRDFINRASKLRVEDIFENGYDPENDPFADEKTETKESEITDSDYETLAYAPIAVFCFVAASDGNIDRKEIEAFQNEVLAGIVSDNKVMQKILLSTMTASETLLHQVLKKEVDVLEKLQNAASILDEKLSEEEALHCKKSLLNIGLTVAKASGGFLGRFGSKVSKEEKRALVALASIFGVAH